MIFFWKKKKKTSVSVTFAQLGPLCFLSFNKLLKMRFFTFKTHDPSYAFKLIICGMWDKFFYKDFIILIRMLEILFLHFFQNLNFF